MVHKKIFKKIKSVAGKVKSAFKKADVKLGGFLPGGPTPSEVRESKIEKQRKQSSTPETRTQQSLPKKSLGTKIKERLGKTLSGTGGEGTEVTRGAKGSEIAFAALPIGRVGKGAVGVAKGISKAVTAGKLPKVGVGFSKVIGSINKFSGKVTKGDKALQVGKFVKKGDKKIAFQTNAKSVEKTNSLLLKVVKQFKKPAVIVTSVFAMAGTYPWAEWALGEAKEGMIFNMQKALNTGDPELINEFLETSDEIFDLTIWENMRRLIPGLNLQFAFGEKAKALQAQWKVNNKIIQDEIIKIETGETDDDKWKRIREEEVESDREAVDYYNSQRKLMVQWEAEARRNQRNADAKFWRKEREKQRVKEAEDRKAIADFWIDYRKTALKLAEDSRPSNLNFGLL